MNVQGISGCVLVLLMTGAGLVAHAADRASDWKEVREAVENKQAQTTLDLLKPLEAAAFANHSWGEGTKALLMRVRVQNRLGFPEPVFPGGKEATSLAFPGEIPNDDPFAACVPSDDDGADPGGLPGCVRQLDAEIPAAPKPVRPILRWFQGRCLIAYAESDSYGIFSRENVPQRADDLIERWNAPKITEAIENHFRQALDDPSLRNTPVDAIREILGPSGAYGDSLRPTLYDLVAHSMAGFLADGPLGSRWDPVASPHIIASSPVFGNPEEFLAWRIGPTDPKVAEFRVIEIYQQLMRFHRDDPDRTAFLHCDLERLRWAGRFASGGDKPNRQLAAIQSFIKENSSHPLSADARQDEVLLLQMVSRTVEAHASAKAGALAFPNHPSGKICKGLMLEMEARELHFSTPQSWPTSGDEIALKPRNIEHLWFRLYRREWKPNLETLEVNEGGKMDYEKIRELLKMRPDHVWDTALDYPKDYQAHSLTVPTPADLTPGEYLLIVSAQKDFSEESEIDWTAVRVSNLRIEDQGVVVDAVTGSPMEGVELDVWQKPKKENSAHEVVRTDENGFFSFKPVLGDTDILVTAMVGENRGVSSGSIRASKPDAEQNAAKETVTFFTDRAIYRPGQSIQFKGILSFADKNKVDYLAVEGKSIAVTLTGPNNQEIATQDFRTNAFGSFSGTFTAPTGSLLGVFNIKAGGRGSESIRVEEYKRPKFEVDISAPEVPVELGRKVTMKGTARTYTGAPVDGAKVEWEVRRESYFNGLGSWLGWNGNPRDSETAIATGTLTTAADGSFSIIFTAEPDGWLDKEKDPAFQFQVCATVTDPTGETRNVERYVSAAYTAFYAGLEVADWQEAGKPVMVKIGTCTHDGEPFPATGVLRVYPLKQPDVCPRDEKEPYDESSLPTAPRPGPAGWEIGGMVREMSVTTKQVNDDCSATVPVDLPAGCYRMVFEALDANQCKVTAIAGVHVVDRGSDRFLTKTPFFVASSAKSVAPGQEVSVVWGSGYEVARALIEWYRDDTLLKREWSIPGRTQQVFTLTPDESMRGGICVRVQQFSRNRHHQWSAGIKVPWSNKELVVKWERITSKLGPGAKDTWTAVVSGPDGKPATAEMVATLYDASLDDLYEHGFRGYSGLFRDAFVWNMPTRSVWYSRWHFTSGGWYFKDGPREYSEIKTPFRTLLRGLDEARSITAITANSYGRSLSFGEHQCVQILDAMAYGRYEPPQIPTNVGGPPPGLVMSGFPVTPATPSSPMSRDDLREEAMRRELAKVVGRRKLDETAFFYPHLNTDKDGKIRITFTMPEGIGSWRFLGMVHDQALRSGLLDGKTVTAKDLMVQPNPPRFLREGDVLEIPIRISNQSDSEQTGLARFTLADAAGTRDLTEKLGIEAPEQRFVIPAKQSRTLAWRITVPDGCGFLRYQARAACGDLTDGEEGWLPVLPRRVAVTDSLALTLLGPGETKHKFPSLGASGGSGTLVHDSLQVQVVSRPAWYAVMALPYLMEYPHECAEQTFSRLYANALGHKVVNSDPKIRRVFEVWRGEGALDSPLVKNQDLAGMMAEETPWLRGAGDDTARRRRVGLLFDENRMSNEIAAAQAKLAKMQLSDGMWPWFSGGQGSGFITAHIVAGYGELRAAGVEVGLDPVRKAVAALDHNLTSSHRELLRAEKETPGILDNNNLSPVIAHILYSRSFFLKDLPLSDEDAIAHRYFINQAGRHWSKAGSRMTAAQIALSLWRYGEQESARLVTRAFRETAVIRPETGMSWPAPPGSAWWWDAPVEAQAMMIAAFAEIDGDVKAVDDCRTWLILQHRDGDWQTTTATAAAIHSLLVGPVGTNPLASDNLVRVALAGKPLEPGKVEPGSGYYECRVPGTGVKPEMSAVSLTKSDKGVSWASVHWRYFEDVSKLAAHDSGGLKIEKHLFVRRPSHTGPRVEPLAGPLRPGDELVTRLVVTSDRELEFVHLKDERGSGTEPVTVLSGSDWREGIGYYEVTRDSATHFFIDRLPKGIQLFEHVSRVQHVGIYQTGLATIRCMYAPEFQARSASSRLEVNAGRSE
jgi:Bacterial Alpha-2-macroglobulin MG10 domain/Alpha-2-macroglobulin family/MG2 domain